MLEFELKILGSCPIPTLCDFLAILPLVKQFLNIKTLRYPTYIHIKAFI